MPMKGWTEADVIRLKQSKGFLEHLEGYLENLASADAKITAKQCKKRGPNKTEAEYARLYLRNVDARYEALTFHMQNGCSYKPDWVVFDTDGLPRTAIECKGSYRFYSHGRARLAFKQCQLEFSGIVFLWATKTKKGWEVE
jgi:hypothetical protein